MPEPLYRITLDAGALLSAHPPRFQHAHKAAMFELAHPDGRADDGEITVSCWPAVGRTELDFGAAIAVEVRPDFYDYAAAGDASKLVEWHVNFADPALFVAYGSALLAQDEMQVVEHPLLGSVREALLARELPARTVTLGEPTPILVQHVERRLRLDTRPDARAGRPLGLYGGLFACSSIDVVRRATTRIEPVEHSNIIAMAAPLGGSGRYRESEVDFVLVTASTAFAAARHESHAAAPGGMRALVHTGLWGCGVFGGNRVLMIALQVLAARAAGLAGLVLHVGHDALAPFLAQDGIDLAHELISRCDGCCTREWLVGELVSREFEWGTGDGN